MRTHYGYPHHRYTHYGYTHHRYTHYGYTHYGYTHQGYTHQGYTYYTTMAHVVGEDAHDADLLLAVREGGAALDLGELDAELRRSKHASMQVSSSESQVVSSEW